MYVPNLAPLVDAHFQTDDDFEAELIYHIIESFKDEPPWPRRLYESGEAAEDLGPYALNALGAVVQDYYDHEAMARLEKRRRLEFPPPPQPTPSTEVGVSGEGREVEEVVEKKGGQKRKTKKKRNPKAGGRGFRVENPTHIVCALQAPYICPNYQGGPLLKRKGKEIVAGTH